MSVLVRTAVSSPHPADRCLFVSCRITVGFVEAGGCIPEKLDAVAGNANIDAEYGNQVRRRFRHSFTHDSFEPFPQGTDFHLIPREGFGWTNASYQVGLTFITQLQRRALGALTPPDVFFRAGRPFHQQ